MLHTARTSVDDGRVLIRLAKRALVRPYRPIMANLIVTRRCNLSCGYCFEYDRVSQPVPLATLKERIDHLARLRTLVVTLTGGETLLHPDIVEVVRYVRARGMTPAMNTNGYKLTRAIIEQLGGAGLYALQLSIDNVRPNRTSAKSLEPLLPKLRLLADHATFRVRVNTVLGGGPPDQAVEVARAVQALGLDAKVSLVRDADGALVPLDPATRRAYDQIRALGRRSTPLLSEDVFQDRLVRDGRRDWKCRAGARYFHVCEHGLVHNCSSRHGSPGIPLADYGDDDLRRAFHSRKPCADTCTQAYAHQASELDRFRSQDRTVDRPVADVIPIAQLVRR
jgi:MoaA/NifB/PqqE/SkfB family radical SAM enzyme